MDDRLHEPPPTLPRASRARLTGRSRWTDRGWRDESDGKTATTDQATWPVVHLAGSTGAGYQAIAALVNDGLPEPRYRIEDVLGAGSNGVVYLATDLPFNREVAIKVSRSADPGVVAACLREARIIASLEHPGIVPVHEMRRGRDGMGWYAMRRLTGRSLEDLIIDYELSSRSARRRVIGINERVTILLRATEAIAFAHQRGVVHQDLKPANIMLDAHGDTLVVDWGSARAPTAPKIPLHGSPAYMAPEQARGEYADARSDIYALGATLFELLFWRLPNAVDDDARFWTMKISGEIQEPTAEELATVPAPLVAIVRKAMAPRPEERYQTAEGFHADLERFQAGLSVTAHLEHPFQALWRWTRRHRTLVAVILGNAIVIAILIAAWTRSEQRDRRRQALISAIDTQLGSEQPLAGEFDAIISQRLDALAELDPTAADDVAARVATRLADHAHALLAAPSLDDDAIARVGRVLALVEEHPDLRDRLARALATRRSQWNRQLVLQGPLQGLPLPWREAWTVDRTGALIALAGSAAADGAVATPIQIAGGIRIELAWKPFDPVAGEVVGVSLAELTGERYLAVVGRDQDGTPFAEVRQSGTTLQRHELPELDQVGRITVERLGSRITLDLDGTTRIAYDDILPLGHGSSRIAIVGAEVHPIRSLQVFEREPPRRLVDLELADRWFRLGLHERALELYRRQTTAADPAIAAEARYKEAWCLAKLERSDEAIAAWTEVLAAEAGRWSLLAGCQLWRHHLAVDDSERAAAVVERLTFTSDDLALDALPHELRQQLFAQIQNLATGSGLMRPDPSRTEQLRLSVRALDALESDRSVFAWTIFGLARALHWDGQFTQGLAVLHNFLTDSGAIDNEVAWYDLSLEARWQERLRDADDVAALPADRLHPGALRLTAIQDLVAAGDYAGAGASARQLVADEALSEVLPSQRRYVPWASLKILAALTDDGDLDLEALATATLTAFHGPDEHKEVGQAQGGFGELLGLATAAAAGVVDEVVVADFLASAAAAADIHGNQSLEAAAIGLLQPSPAFFERAWRSPRGRHLLRDLAARRRPIRDLVGDAMALLVVTRLGDDLTPRSDPPPWFDDALWTLARDVVAGYFAGNLTTGHLAAWGLAYLGNPLAPSWSTLDARLPEARTPTLGTLLALRHLRQRDPSAAAAILATLGPALLGAGDGDPKASAPAAAGDDGAPTVVDPRLAAWLAERIADQP